MYGQIPASLPPTRILGAGRLTPPPAAGRTGGLDRSPALGNRVAIVEDELMVAWSLEALVDDLGYEVVATYARGEAAAAAIDDGQVDIVLMDINLGGGIDGVETARRLRKAQDLRIIFISAYADPETHRRIGIAVPGAPLLRKPVSTVLLAAALSGGSGPGG